MLLLNYLFLTVRLIVAELWLTFGHCAVQESISRVVLLQEARAYSCALLSLVSRPTVQYLHFSVLQGEPKLLLISGVVLLVLIPWLPCIH